jgi:hypothetical protein
MMCTQSIINESIQTPHFLLYHFPTRHGGLLGIDNLGGGGRGRASHLALRLYYANIKSSEGNVPSPRERGVVCARLAEFDLL